MSHEEALARVAELEQELARQKAETERYRMDARAMLHMIPFEPLTEEELERMTTDIHGPQIRDLIAELERESA